jgi:hypothetical protein
MTKNHAIAPPPELVQQWVDEYIETKPRCTAPGLIATRAAQWGADTELEVCCEYLVRCAQWEPEDVEELRAARRPKPPSLKEQALLAVDTAVAGYRIAADVADVVRRALEQIDD